MFISSHKNEEKGQKKEEEKQEKRRKMIRGLKGFFCFHAIPPETAQHFFSRNVKRNREALEARKKSDFDDPRFCRNVENVEKL